MAVCLLRFWLRNASPVKVIENPISDGIVFKNELTHLSLFEAKRVEKSQAIAAQLDGLQEQHLVSLKPEQLLSLMCSFPGYLKSSYFMRLVYARGNDLTYKSIRFKKPLDIF